MFQRISKAKVNPFRSGLKLVRNQQHDIHTKIAIVGGGSGGMNCAAQLQKSGLVSPGEITVFDPSALHWYQPGFTMVAGGILGDTDAQIAELESGLLHKPMQHVFSPYVHLIPDKVTEYDPDSNKLFTSKGEQFTYDYLIVATGIELRFDLIEGLTEALDDPEHPCGSMYRFDYAKKINRLRAKFKEGKVVCVQPAMPIKCGGAPQKFAYLADDGWRNNGTRKNIDLHFYTTLPTMFAVKKYGDRLGRLVAEKNIKSHHQFEIFKIDTNTQTVYFKNLQSENMEKPEIISSNYDLLHVPPPQRPNKFTANSKLSDKTGFVDVNIKTLQSKNYDNVFGLGDAINAPCAKTAAAAFSQTPIIIENIKQKMNGVSNYNLKAKYNGYSSCPIFVGNKKLMLAEFIYENIPHESFPMDQGTPYRLFYYLKRYGFPFVYWNMATRGSWYGPTGPFRPKFEQPESAPVSDSQTKQEHAKKTI